MVCAAVDEMEATRRHAVTLLHLSDIHRTRDDQVSNEELLNALQAELAAHADDGVPAPQAVVISGGLAQLINMLPGPARTSLVLHREHITRQVGGRPNAAQALRARLHEDCARGDDSEAALSARIMDERSYR